MYYALIFEILNPLETSISNTIFGFKLMITCYSLHAQSQYLCNKVVENALKSITRT